MDGGDKAEPGSRTLLRATKFDGSAHWIQPFTVLADDGCLLVTKYYAGTPIYTSRGEFRSPYDSTVYFWRNRWYNVFRLAKPGCSLALWYCNVATPAIYDYGQLSYVNLDLDVAVRPDGNIELLDEDEFEGDKEQVLADMYQFNMAATLYGALLENVTSEQASKMSAMENASNNATDMIGTLTLRYNRQRQAVITTELTEIVAGAESV